MNKLYFRGVQGVVLVCDLCDFESFQALDGWLVDFLENTDRDDTSEFSFILLANKVDLARTKSASGTGEIGTRTSGTAGSGSRKR